MARRVASSPSRPPHRPLAPAPRPPLNQLRNPPPLQQLRRRLPLRPRLPPRPQALDGIGHIDLHCLSHDSTPSSYSRGHSPAAVPMTRRCQHIGEPDAIQCPGWALTPGIGGILGLCQQHGARSSHISTMQFVETNWRLGKRGMRPAMWPEASKRSPARRRVGLCQKFPPGNDHESFPDCVVHRCRCPVSRDCQQASEQAAQASPPTPRSCSPSSLCCGSFTWKRCGRSELAGR